jgi:hypothetical protein
VPAAEHIERQIAVAIVIAVEEPALLMAVQRIVGGIEIKDDLLRRPCVGLEEQIDEQPLDRRWIVTDLVIARRLGPAQLQPVERRFAGNRRAVLTPRRELAGQHRHQRVVAQRVVIDQILILVLDQSRRTAILKA